MQTLEIAFSQLAGVKSIPEQGCGFTEWVDEMVIETWAVLKTKDLWAAKFKT